MRHRYPFDALHWLRQQQVDRRAAVLGESAARTARARAEEARAEAARQRRERAIAELSGAEQVRLDQGQLRAADLHGIADWRRGADAALQAAAEREQRAREARAADAAQELADRRALGSAHGAAQLIDRHRNAHRALQQVAQERAEEEAAAEQWTASRFPARRV